MEILALGLRLWIVLVLLAAVVGKVRRRAAWGEFRNMLAAIGVPARLVGATAVTVAAVEATVVALGPWPRTAPVGMALATALFLAFTAGVAVVVRRRITAACRCFGAGGTQLRRLHVVRNAVLTVAAGVAAVASAVASGPVSLPAVLLCLVAGGVAAVLVAQLEDLVGLFSDARPVASGSGPREPAGR